MKVEIFEGIKISELERRINNFFEKKPNIKVFNTTQSQSDGPAGGYFVTISIFYTE